MWITRLQWASERDGGVRQILVSTFHQVILRVILNRCLSAILATVAVLQTGNRKKRKRKKSLELKYDYRPTGRPFFHVLNCL